MRTERCRHILEVDIVNMAANVEKKRNITFPVRSYTQGANHPFWGIPALAITSKVVHQK